MKYYCLNSKNKSVTFTIFKMSWSIFNNQQLLTENFRKISNFHLCPYSIKTFLSFSSKLTADSGCGLRMQNPHAEKYELGYRCEIIKLKSNN